MSNQKNETMTKAADTGKSVHLSASAGSGKTRALKDRYLALLDVLDRRGLNIDQAVAITFTDKAAAEIKDRVLRDLPETMLKKIIRGRQDLRISTIHSFCMNLLKRYPLEAGLPPDFGVLDSRDQAAKIQKSVEDTLEESDLDQQLMAPLKNFTVDELIETISFLLSIRSRLKRMEIDANGPDGLLTSIRSGMEMDTAEAELAALIASPEWRISFQEMERLLRAEGENYYDSLGPGHLLLAEATDVQTAFKTATSLALVYFTLEGAPRKKPRITAKAWKAKNDRQEYEKLFENIQTLLYRFRNSHARARAGQEAISMLRLYLRAEERYQQAKLREGLLDFDDLEISAYRLLQNIESADILYWLDRKILHFLVDEFQDTSDIQWAILDKLTGEIFAGQGADKLMAPTLFVVGDEKQSIYRFREANYRLIEIVKRNMETLLPLAAREVLTLEKNYRSTPEVIETVNRVFTGLWAGTYTPSEVERKEHKGSAKLIEILQDAENSGLTEALMLAREIGRFVETGSAVYEKTDRTWNSRPAAYGDCAILIQSRTKLKEYEAALQAQGIPYRVIGGIGFYEEDEVQAVMNTLFFLWNKDDTLSLAASLKSALFGLSDKDIFDLMQEKVDMIDALAKQRPDISKLLHHWQNIAGVASLSVLIHTIISDTGAYIRFGREKSQAIFNLDKLLDTAREFDRRGYTTLQDFVEWVKNFHRTEQREATADMNLPGFQGSVSILTVHKAKGLEFPVVFLPGMNQAARSLTIGPEALISEADGVKRVAIKDPDNPVYDDMWKGENGEQEEIRREHQRLLYVAMTRARDHLIMLGTLGTGKTPVKQNTWLDYLHKTAVPPGATEIPATRFVTSYAYPDWQAQNVYCGPQISREQKKEEQSSAGIAVQTMHDNISPLPRSGALEWKRATDFIEEARGSAIESLLPPVEARTVSPLTRGKVFHRCLEDLAKNGTYDIQRIIGEYPDIQALGPDAQEDFIKTGGSILKKVRGNKELAWIFEEKNNAYSELPFLYKKGHALVSGIMDRVVIKDGTGFVIDYKSILIGNDDTLNEWKEHYKPQIKIYCEAVKEIFRLEKVEGYLLFLDSNRLERVV